MKGMPKIGYYRFEITTMTVGLDSKKFKKRFVLLLVWLMFLLLLVVLVPLLSDSSKSNSKIVTISGLFILFSVPPALILKSLIRIKNCHPSIIKLEDECLQIQSLIYSRLKIIRLADIESLNLSEKPGALSQVAIFLKSRDSATLEIVNQFKGRSIYFNDYVLDKTSFLKLIQTLENKLDSEFSN
jgi:hypothetical protein